MDTQRHYRQVVSFTPVLSEQTRKTLLEGANEMPEDVQQALTTAISMLERRLISALDEFEVNNSNRGN